MNTILAAMRLPFLILTPVCIFLGVSIAIFQGIQVNVSTVILIALAALSSHISVNTLNEYFDFKSGLDAMTQRTPFSGGSGALVANPQSLSHVLIVGMFTLCVTVLIGLYFVYQLGFEVLPIGFIGVILIVTYTSWINKSPMICLIAPGLGFGILFVVGTVYVLNGEFAQLSWYLALVPFFLVNNLLLLNQYPDIKADQKVGRNHIPIAYGVKTASIIYTVFSILTFGLIIVLVTLGVIPKLSLIALLPLPLAISAINGAFRYGENIGQYPQFLTMNVITTLSVPLLLGISLLL
ncbi:MAG: prenyltransferase [Xanthomonadales bacterium]|nr:prenyltransferase [Xanthomonadales bacterium]